MLTTIDQFRPEMTWAVFEPELLGVADLYLVAHQSQVSELAAEITALSRVGSVVAWHQGIDISQTEAGYYASGFSLIQLHEEAQRFERPDGEVWWSKLAEWAGLDPYRKAEAGRGPDSSWSETQAIRDQKFDPTVTRIGRGGWFSTDIEGRTWDESLAELRQLKAERLGEVGWGDQEEVHRVVHEVTQTSVGAAPYHFLNLVCPETKLTWVLDTLVRQRLMDREGRAYVAEWDDEEGRGFIDRQWGWTWFVDCEGGRSDEVELAAKLWRAMPATSGAGLEAAVRAVVAAVI